MNPVPSAVGGAVLLVLTNACLVTTRAAMASARARARLEWGGTAPRRRGQLDHEVPARLLPLLEDAALPLDPRRAWHVWVAGSPLLVGCALVVAGPAAAAVTAISCVIAPATVLALRRGASGRAVDAALPHALESIARSLRGGAGTHQALAEAAACAEGPLGAELGRVGADLRGGRSLERALTDLQDRRPEPGVRLAVAALLLGAEAGGAHARTLDGVAEGVRARLAVGAEVRALAAQARLSAAVIAAAPLAFGALAAGADGATATFLLRTPLGLVCLVVGLALDGAGALWMHRIARVEP